MPELSRFYGIVIFMNYNDHEPPHFHARYGEQEVTMEIHGGLITGKMSKRALRLVIEWAEQHEVALLDNWTRSRARRTLLPIEPLP